jgi:hypothetical protein
MEGCPKMVGSLSGFLVKVETSEIVGPEVLHLAED